MFNDLNQGSDKRATLISHQSRQEVLPIAVCCAATNKGDGSWAVYFTNRLAFRFALPDRHCPGASL